MSTGIAFICWSAVSAAWSPDPAGALLSTAKVAGVLFSAWVCGTFLAMANPPLSATWRKGQLGALLVAALSVCLLIFVNDVFLSDRHATGEYREIYLISPMGTEILRSWYNQAAAFFILWAWVVLAQPEWRLRTQLLTFLVVGAVAILVGYWVGVAALAAGVLVYLISLWFRRAVSVLMALTVVVTTFAMPLVAAKFPSFEDAVATSPSGNTSVLHRTMIWRFVADAIAEKPWLGWGMDGSRHVPGGNDRIPLQLDGQAKNLERLPLHPHDTILQIWLELGVVGAILFSAIVAGAYLMLGRLTASPSLAASLMGCLTAIFAMMGASFSIWSNWWLAAMAIVFVAASQLARKRHA